MKSACKLERQDGIPFRFWCVLTPPPSGLWRAFDDKSCVSWCVCESLFVHVISCTMSGRRGR